MAKFTYIARDTTGKKITGIEESASMEDLVKRLQAKNLLVISLVPFDEADKIAADDSGFAKTTMHFHNNIGEADKIVFCRQLSTLLGAGITLSKALGTILKQVTSRKFYEVIKAMIRDLESGLSLKEAMLKHPKVFPGLWVNLVESGEASGNLAVILDRLSSYIEREAEFKKKLISAMVYPIILMLVNIGAFLFLSIKIIPTFEQMFKGFNLELPLITKIIMAVSLFIRTKYIIIAIVFIVVIILIRNFLKTYNGRKIFEKILFKLPVFGSLFNALAVEKFSSSMYTLIESGVPILYSLEITERSVENITLAEIVHTIKENVKSGMSLSIQLEKSNFFEPMVVQMVKVGEEIGELPQMLKRINIFYTAYVETFIERLQSLFEPLMILMMGLMIGAMVAGVFLPIFQLSSMKM